MSAGGAKRAEKEMALEQYGRLLDNATIKGYTDDTHNWLRDFIAKVQHGL